MSPGTDLIPNFSSLSSKKVASENLPLTTFFTFHFPPSERHADEIQARHLQGGQFSQPGGFLPVQAQHPVFLRREAGRVCAAVDGGEDRVLAAPAQDQQGVGVTAEGRVALAQGFGLRPPGRQLRVEVPQAVALFRLPVGGAAEGVAQALHALFVAVVDGGHARQGELDGGGQALEAAAPVPLGRIQMEVRPGLGTHALSVHAAAQDAAKAGGVVAAQQVHQAAVHGGGIVQLLLQQEVPELLGPAALQQEIQHRRAQGVVHHAVQAPAQGVSALDAVAHLVRGVLPDLAQQQGLGVLGLEALAHLLDGLIRQLVGHVQPPAPGPGPQPAAQDGLLALDDEVLPARVPLVHLGQRAEVPPAAVVVGEGAEVIPAKIRALLALVRAQAGIAAIAVEVDAVGPGVGEDAIQHDADAQFLRRGAQGAEVLRRAQHGVDFVIVPGVVAVVGAGLEDGVTVDAAHPQGFQLRQPLDDPLESAAVEVVGDILRLPLPGGIFDRLVPAPVRLDAAAPSPVAADAALEAVAAGGVAVGEDLVQHRALGPVRGGESPVVDRDAPGPGLAADQAVPAKGQRAGQAEGIVDQPRLRGGGDPGGQQPVGIPAHGVQLAVHGQLRLHIVRGLEPQRHPLAAFHRPEGAAVQVVIGQVQQLCRPVREDGDEEQPVLHRAGTQGQVFRHGLADQARHGRLVIIGVQRGVDRGQHGPGAVAPEGEAVPLPGEAVVGAHGVPQAAYLVDDGQGAVALGDELTEAAGLEGRGHQQEVRARIDAAGQGLAVADPSADPAPVAGFKVPHGVLIGRVAAAQQHEGHVPLHQRVQGGEHQVEALLGRHAGHHGDNGGVRADLQAQLGDQGLLAAALVPRVRCVVVEGEGRVGGGVKADGVQAVQDAAHVAAPGPEHAVQALPEVGAADLVGVAGADGVHPVGEEAAGFQQVAVVPVAQAVQGEPAVVDAEEVPGRVEAEPALEGQVVDGQHGFQRPLGPELVLGFQQEGQGRRVPVVAVQHLRPEVQQGNQLQHRPLEKGVLLHLGAAAPIDGVAEIVFAVHQVDGQAVQLQLLQPGVLVPPAQVHIDVGHVLHPVGVFLLDTAVIGRDDPGLKALIGQGPGQAPRHVRQAPGLAQRGALRRRQQHGRQGLPPFQQQQFRQTRIGVCHKRYDPQFYIVSSRLGTTGRSFGSSFW